MIPTSVLWIHQDKGGCGSYRCYIPGLSLEGHGFDSNFLESSHVTPDNLAQLDGIDILVIQRTVGTYAVQWLQECRRRGIKTVFEIDDDLFHIPSRNQSAWYWHKKPVQRMLVEELQMVDQVVVSTPPLRDVVAVEARIPEDRIAVCFNHLHPTVWPEMGEWPRFDNGTWTIVGWQGSATHDADFNEVLPALKRLVDERPNTLIRFFGNVPSTVRGVLPENRFQWARGVPFDRYPAALWYMHFDIGLAPVTASSFNRCKSNVKWVEYAWIGVPSIASNVYPYATSIDHGRTGFLASTPDEWYAALSTLVDDPALRTQVASAAQAEVRAQWGPSRASAWVQVFDRLVPRKVEHAERSNVEVHSEGPAVSPARGRSECEAGDGL